MATATRSLSDLAEDVAAYLRERYPGVDLSDFGPVRGSRPARIAGLIVWDGFADESQAERQTALWDGLSERFPLADLSRLGLLMALTAEEVRASEPGD